MNSHDPLFALGGERTIIKPRLGMPGSATDGILDNILGPVGDSGLAAQPVNQSEDPDFDLLFTQLAGKPAATKNLLLAQASPILRLMCLVGNRANLRKPAALSKTLHAALVQLDARLDSGQRTQAERLAVRYLLCTFLDERAANTPWGGSGQWAAHSLLLRFFSETWGGEKVFLLIEKMLQNPTGNRELLELMSVVLALGLQGKHKVEAGGEMALAQLGTRLFNHLGLEGQAAKGSLHPAFWQSKAPRSNQHLLRIPLWLPVSGLCALAAVFFLTLYLRMNALSDEAFGQIASLSFPKPEFSQTGFSEPAPSTAPELPMQLQEEIIRGELTLKQIGNRSTVILVGDGLFNSGSAELVPKARPLVEKVARTLALHPGHITVTGFTDNQPIRSIQYPSNWQLSSARAEHVGQYLGGFLPNIAIATEGAGAANPIAPNTTGKGRALNRRVEITLVHAQ